MRIHCGLRHLIFLQFFPFSLSTDDFKSIPSAQLTLEQFHTNDAEVEFDPPSYIRSVVEHAHGTSSGNSQG